MALRVIGAGLGRTGTMSLKIALEQLGFSPCHHMMEVFQHPEQRAFWLKAAQREKFDWEELFGQYKASVDWPSCHFYKELSERYPDAKVILTERDPEKWFDSFSNTILKVMQQMLADTDPVTRQSNRFAELIIADQTFHHQFDKDHVIAVYKRHNAQVRRSIPQDKLLSSMRRRAGSRFARSWELRCPKRRSPSSIRRKNSMRVALCSTPPPRARSQILRNDSSATQIRRRA